MRKIIALCLSVLAVLPACLAQSTKDEVQVSMTIARLFSGMEKGDSAMVHGCFTPTVTMATLRRDQDGHPQLMRESSLDGFLKAVGTPHPDTWYEEIWDLKVQVDGDLAQAWCDYAFYVGNRFSHCGVDAFQLFRTPDGWRIFHLADTRRTANCSVPPSIESKHKP